MLDMSLEEQALRHADEFFTGPEKWHRGSLEGPNGRRCLVATLVTGMKVAGVTWDGRISSMSRITGLKFTGYWNDHECKDFAALKAKLQERILFYQNQRLKHSYIVILGPGRRVRV